MQIRTQWHRLNFVIKNIQYLDGSLGSSIVQFRNLIGIKKIEDIYNVKNNIKPLSPRIARKIAKMLPACSADWLLRGEGETPLSPIVTSNPQVTHQSSDLSIYKDSPLLGKWALVAHMDYDLISTPTRWVLDEHSVQAPQHMDFHEFLPDGNVNYYELGTFVQSGAYIYDRHKQLLSMDNLPSLVSSITETEYEEIDWLNMELDGVQKRLYKRIQS